MTAKRIFALLIAILTLCIFAMPTFAEASEIVPFINISEYLPNATVQGEIYYTTSASQETWSAQISQKGTGVIGVDICYDDNRITQPYDIIRTQFDLSMWDNNARVNISAGYGEFIKSDQLWTPTAYIGFTLKMNPWFVGGDTEPQGVILDCYRTYGYTLDYPSNERYYISYDDLIAVDYDGARTAFKLNMFIDTNTSLGTTTLYLSTNSGTMKIDTINTYIIDPYVMQWGMFDPIQIDLGNEAFAIRNVQKYVVDNGYTEGYNDGYVFGYRDGGVNGYNEGYTDGKNRGYDSGFNEGNIQGYHNGYSQGKKDGSGYIDVPEIVDSYFDGIASIFDGLNFEIFGISIAGLLVSVLVALIVLFIIKKVK